MLLLLSKVKNRILAEGNRLFPCSFDLPNYLTGVAKVSLRREIG